tara:strand:- start:6802 stop:6960 length:159 start_codon:yes stop_codon:yes gene_type:complete
MAHDNHQTNAKLFRGKFNTGNLGRCNHITRNPNHKQVAKTLIKNHLHRHTGI